MRSPLQKASVQRTIATITEKIEPHLEAGFLYVSNPIKTSYGLSGSEIYRMIDGQLQREDGLADTLRTELKFGSRMIDVVKKFPEFTKVKFQFEKGEAAEVKAYSVPMLLQDISQTIKDLLRKKKGNKASCQVEFFENGELELAMEGRILTAVSETENTFFEIKEDAKCLYQALDRKTTKLRFVFDQNSLSTQADISFPEFGIKAISENKGGDDTLIQDSATLFAYLESGEEEKVKAAMAGIQTSPVFLELAKDRYLSLLQARSNDPSITIDALPTHLLNKVEVKLLERTIHAKHLNLAYLNSHESKVIVDVLGSILKDCVDIQDFKRKAIQTASESALQQLLSAQSALVKAQLQKRKEECPQSWMSQLCRKLLDLDLEKIYFEKTLFSEANNSLVLEEFYLFLGLSSHQSIFIDIHQSEAPKIPEIIWMFREVPRINWLQTP